MTFEIVPDGSKENQMYMAFRISETSGLVPADNLSGKPVVMEIIPQEISPVQPQIQTNSKTQTVNYLIPAVCTVKIKDGSELLMQRRVPVYQLGVLGSMPVNATLQ